MRMPVICGAVIALAVTAAGAAEDPRSANYILPACRDAVARSNTTSAFLQGYCMGIVSEISHMGFMVALTQNFTSNANGVPDPMIRKMFCLVTPDEITIDQMVRVVVTYIEEHPARIHEDFRDLALEALRAAWPCK